MTNSELEALIRGGENERVDFKWELHISEPKGKADFVKDVLSLVNAHGEGNRYLLIGVDEKLPPQDIQHLNLDDADLHQIIDTFIEPRVNFAYRAIAYNGVVLGIVEIFRSIERFHVIKKDYQALDASGKQIRLERGQIWIRRGAANSHLTAQDFKILRDDYLKDYLQQPHISVSFANGENTVELAADWIGQKGKFSGFETVSEAVIISPPSIEHAYRAPRSAPLVFRVENLSTIEAKNVAVWIRPPSGCEVVGHQAQPISIPTPDGKPLKMDRNIMTAEVDSLLRRPVFTTKSFYVTFPIPDATYEFTWTARAGNMLTEKTGKLTVKLLNKDAPPTTNFPISLASIVNGIL